MARASFHPLAERELTEAAQHYEYESPGLGALFLDGAERCERAINEHPEAGVAVHGDIRRRLLHTFPYELLYRSPPREFAFSRSRISSVDRCIGWAENERAA